jgi:DNA-directed RNA polymerase
MVWAAIGDLVKAPVELMGWLQDVSDEMTKAGLDIAWTTPTGFRVHQAAFTDKRTTISVKIGGSITKRRGKVRTDKLCSRGQRNGIAPNFIHALDASVLTETMLLLKAQGVRDVGVVHDSFATHAANAQILASSLREAVYRVFLKDPLGDFKRECEQRLGRTLPDPPASGTLVLDCVKQSLYFYS